MPIPRFHFPMLVPAVLTVGLLAALRELTVQAGVMGGGIGLATGMLAVAFWMMYRKADPPAELIVAGPVAATIVSLVALTVSTPSLLVSSATWVSVLAGAVFLIRRSLRENVSAGLQAASAPPVQQIPSEADEWESILSLAPHDKLSEEELFLEDEELELDESDELSSHLKFSGEQTVQSWARLQTATKDRLEGTLSVEFAAGQKSKYVHIPFAPFFSTIPAGFCMCDGEGRVEAELEVVQTYGARMNVRRRGDISQPTEVQVMLSVVASRTQLRAA